MRMGPRQAEAMVTAYLGRPPQDELEAAVVLESWGGVRGPHALATAARMDFPPAAPTTSARHGRSALDDADDGAGSAAESIGALALVVAVLVLAAVASGHGAEAAADAWRPAMPATLGATWLLRRRYGAGRAAVGLLRRDRWVVAALVALATAPLATWSETGVVLSVFAVLGVGGAVAVLRGWGPATAAAVVAVAGGAAALDVPAVPTMAAAAAVVALAALGAVATSPGGEARPRSWRRAVPAGLAGSTTGLFMVSATSSATGAATWVVGLALAPSLLATLAGSAHMARFWDAVPDVLAATPATERSPRARRVACTLVAASMALTVAALGALSLGAWATADALGEAAAAEPLLVAFAAVAVVALAVTILEAFARPLWATGTGLAATGVQAGVGELAGVPTWAVVALATAAAAVVALPALVALLRRPELTLATLV